MRVAIVNGQEQSVCTVLDRGLQYGDGLFETMLCLAGKPIDFTEHWQRLSGGCERIRIVCPDIRAAVLAAVERWGGERAVAKLIVTRGSSERGYRCAPDVAPNWILTISDAARLPPETYDG